MCRGPTQLPERVQRRPGAGRRTAGPTASEPMPTTQRSSPSGTRKPTDRPSPATSASRSRTGSSAPSRTVTTRKIAASVSGVSTGCDSTATTLPSPPTGSSYRSTPPTDRETAHSTTRAADPRASASARWMSSATSAVGCAGQLPWRHPLLPCGVPPIPRTNATPIRPPSPPRPPPRSRVDSGHPGQPTRTTIAVPTRHPTRGVTSDAVTAITGSPAIGRLRHPGQRTPHHGRQPARHPTCGVPSSAATPITGWARASRTSEPRPRSPSRTRHPTLDVASDAVTAITPRGSRG